MRLEEAHGSVMCPGTSRRGSIATFASSSLGVTPLGGILTLISPGPAAPADKSRARSEAFQAISAYRDLDKRDNPAGAAGPPIMRPAAPLVDGSQRMTGCVACVVTYNSAPTIGRLLISLDAEPAVSAVEIFDNASTDGTVDAIQSLSRSTSKPLTVHRSSINIGFPAACNRMLAGVSTDVVALVNPDVELNDQVLSRLVRQVRAIERIGVSQLPPPDSRWASPSRGRPGNPAAHKAPRWQRSRSASTCVPTDVAGATAGLYDRS